MCPSTSTNDRGTLPRISLPTPLKASAFWAAVILPFCSLALLMNGMETTTHYLSLVLLVGANVVALVVGHDYRR